MATLSTGLIKIVINFVTYDLNYRKCNKLVKKVMNYFLGYLRTSTVIKIIGYPRIMVNNSGGSTLGMLARRAGLT